MASRAGRWALTATAAAALVLLASTASAFAAGPATFSSPYPASGGLATSRSSAVRVTVSDPAGVQSGAITVAGATISYTAVDYPIGHWEDPDGCGAVWVVDDYTQAILTAYATAPGLPLGPNTATATVRNNSGIDSDYSWSYTVDLAPVITTVTPANGAIVGATSPTISATITDEDSSFAATMTVDGSVVAPTYIAGTKTFSYTPSTPFADPSTHSVTMEVRDSRGSTATRSWSFTVSSTTGGTFSSASPAPGGFVTAQNVRPSVRVYDPAGVQSGSIAVPGATIVYTALDYPVGHWEDPDGCGVVWVVDDNRHAILTAIPMLPGLPVGPNMATANVRNYSGATSTYSWSYTVDLPPTIPTVMPADGEVVSSLTPTISATIADEDSTFGALMTVDGAAVVPTYNAGTKTFTYTPSVPYPDFSQHFVTIQVQDSRGSTTTRSWSFTIVNNQSGAWAGYSAYAPGSGATLTDADVALGVQVDSVLNGLTVANPVSNPASKLYLDGTQLPTNAGFPVGYWDGDPDCGAAWVVTDPTIMTLSATAPNVVDGVHTVRAEVVDDMNLTNFTEWSFTMAAPPKASNRSPAAGTSDTTPEIRATITDNGGVPSVTMKVDGATVPATFNSSTGVLSYTPTVPLSDNATHTVTLEMSDAGGHASTVSWNFFVSSTGTVTFSAWVPGKDTTLTVANTNIRARAVSSFDMVRASTRVWVDDIPRTVSYLSGGTDKDFTVQSTVYNLGDGVHSARVEVTDVNQISSETAWNFTVAIPPSVSAPAPVNGTTVRVPRPAIGATIGDNMTGPLNVRLTLDGAVVYNAPAPQGEFRWVPPSNMADNSNHSATLLVTDAVGATRSATWTFRVASAPAMSDANDCATCHPAYVPTHPASNCAGCHSEGTDVDGNHNIVGDPAPAGPCIGCHGGHGTLAFTPAQCTGCHSATWPAVPRHDAAEYQPLHDTTTAGCSECHDVSLITEHAKYPTVGAFKNQCATCHTSTDSRVSQAITNGDTACGACHTTSTSHYDAHDSNLAQECTQCHATNLVDVEQHKPGSCSGCHDSADATVQAAIAAGNKDCSACHTSADHMSMHVSVTNSTCFGAGCHDDSKNLVTVHALYAGPGSENPQYANQCELCHDNPAVNTATSGTACTGSCHTPPPHTGRAAGHQVTSASDECTECHGDTIEGVHGAFSDLTHCAWCHSYVGNWQRGSECLDCHGSHMPFGKSAFNDQFPGYLSWQYVEANAGELNAAGPHGSYTTGTSKCAVCHAVHRGKSGSAGLTAWGGTSGGPNNNAAYASCIFCHGPSSTFSDARITLGPATPGNPLGTLAPHETCDRCHTSSLHGAGTSAYPVLASKLLNASADRAIASDIASGNNGVTAATFDGSPATRDLGTSLGVGYLCTDCHDTAERPRAFAVNEPNARPGHVGGHPSTVTGHRIDATATTTWNEDGSFGSGFEGTTDQPGDSTIAWRDAKRCEDCHDAKNADGSYAFPHGYIDATDPTKAVSSIYDANASYLWMTMAAGANAPSVVATRGAEGTDASLRDGVCLKCHRNDDGTQGIGKTY